MEASKYLKEHEAQGRFAIVEIGISRRDILVETYGQDVIVELLRRMEATLQKTEWAKLPAVHTSTGRVFFLLRMDAFDSRTQLTTALAHLMHLNEYISIGHLVVHIAFHIGICPLTPGLSVADAMNHANLALHEANPICFYNAEMQQKAEFQSRIESLQQGRSFPQGVRCLVPAEIRPRDEKVHRRRGARALAQPRARLP